MGWEQRTEGKSCLMAGDLSQVKHSDLQWSGRRRCRQGRKRQARKTGRVSDHGMGFRILGFRPENVRHAALGISLRAPSAFLIRRRGQGRRTCPTKPGCLGPVQPPYRSMGRRPLDVVQHAYRLCRNISGKGSKDGSPDVSKNNAARTCGLPRSRRAGQRFRNDALPKWMHPRDGPSGGPSAVLGMNDCLAGSE